MKEPKIPSKSYWHGQKPVAKLLLDKIKNNNNLLEIGIGQGGLAKLILKKQPHLNYIGFDINNKSLQIANKLLKKICLGKYRVLKLSQDIDLVKKFGKGKFDFVVCCGVLDYAKDPDQVIKNVRDLLKHNGYFAFTLFDNLSSSDYDGKSSKQMYISTNGIRAWGYKESYVKKLLKKLKFEICSMKLGTRLYRNSLSELSGSEIKAIKKNLGHPYDDHFVILARKK